MQPTTFRFVHAADLHLDAPFRGLRRASPAVTLALGQARLAAWDALVQLTLDQNAAFLLLAGDICDGAERAVGAQRRLLDGLQRLSAEGIRTFIVRGDEDPAERWLGIHQWPDGVHCFGAREVETVAVTAAGGQTATIYGISHAADRSANPAARFRRASASGVHIGLLHASVGRDNDVTSCTRCSLGDLQAADMDYWALGHDHRHRTLAEGRPWVVYPGTTQGRGLSDEDLGPKGAVVVTVTDGAVGDVRLHALDAVRLMTADVDASPLAGMHDIRRALVDAGRRLRTENVGRSIVVRAVVSGRNREGTGGQPADRIWARLLRKLREEDANERPFVWWDSVRDRTEVGGDGNQNDLSVHVRRLVDALRRTPGGVDRLLADHGVPPEGPGAHGEEPPADAFAADDPLARAERLTIDLLERGQP